MGQKRIAVGECRKIITSYQDKTKEKQENAVPVLYKAFYDAVIENQHTLYEKIRSTRNVKELAVYMRNGQFAEDACDDFAAQMLAAVTNNEIISDYNQFVESIYDIFKKYNLAPEQFRQYADTWSARMMQPVMKGAEERRLTIVEIGTGAGSEAAKKLHGFLFGKTTEIAITMIWGSSGAGKAAGKAMREYLGTGEFKAQRDCLAKYVLEHIEEYANELAKWVCDGYNDIFSARIKMAGQLLDDYMQAYP